MSIGGIYKLFCSKISDCDVKEGKGGPVYCMQILLESAERKRSIGAGNNWTLTFIFCFNFARIV